MLKLTEEIDRDIGLSPCRQVEVIEHRPANDKNPFEEAVLLVQQEGGYRLLCARRAEDDDSKWNIKELPVDVFLGDPLLATETWVTFDRRYPHRPTGKDIEDFLASSRQ